MSATCTACNGTGHLPGSGYLDCPHCETATQRVMLETWAKEQGMRIDSDQLWAVFRKGQEVALEDCAKICDEKAYDFQKVDTTYAAGKKFGAFECADAIRTLKP